MASILTIVPAWTEPATQCLQCGHTGDWHRTTDAQCTYEILDDANHAWARCGCAGWRG